MFLPSPDFTASDYLSFFTDYYYISTGYGKGPQLQWLNMLVVNISECGLPPSGSQSETSLCVKSVDSKGVKRGKFCKEVGVPLVIQRHRILVGMLDNDVTNCASGGPHKFFNIASYFHWITKTIDNVTGTVHDWSWPFIQEAERILLAAPFEEALLN